MFFSEVPGNVDLVEMSTDTGNTAPISQHPYSVPIAVRSEVKKEIDKLEKQGIISRSHSPWCSPLVPVRKANGDIPLCVDFRRVNEVTVKDLYYMPVLEELLMKVGGSKCLSKLDLTKGFISWPSSWKIAPKPPL